MTIVNSLSTYVTKSMPRRIVTVRRTKMAVKSAMKSSVTGVCVKVAGGVSRVFTAVLVCESCDLL
jgi:ribosomal protein S3